MSKRQKLLSHRWHIVDALPEDCSQRIHSFLALNEKALTKRVYSKWPCANLSLTQSIIVHLVTSVFDSQTQRPTFSFSPAIGQGVVFECRKRGGSVRTVKFALQLPPTLEKTFLLRFCTESQTWRHVENLMCTGTWQWYVLPHVSYFENDVNMACKWMLRRCIEIFTDTNLICALASQVFTFAEATQ